MEIMCEGLSFVLQQNIAKIFINGEINSEIANEFISLMYALEFINEDIPLDGVLISITSPGGSVLDGYSMFSSIKTSNLNVITINAGVCASIAGIIFLASNTRYAFDNSLFMLHQPSGGDEDVLTKVSETLQVILKRAFIGHDVEALMDVETWITASEMVEMGVVKPENVINTEFKVDLNKLLKTEKTSFNIYNIMEDIQKNNIEEMKKISIFERLKSLRNVILPSVELEEEITNKKVIADESDSEEEEEIVDNKIEEEEVISDKLPGEEDEIVNELEPEKEEEEAEEMRISELEKKVSELETRLSELETLLAKADSEMKNLENETLLNAKKEFLVENKIVENDNLLKLDLETLKTTVESVKVSKTAPILSNIIKEGIVNKLEDLTNEEANKIATENPKMFANLYQDFKNRKNLK